MGVSYCFQALRPSFCPSQFHPNSFPLRSSPTCISRSVGWMAVLGLRSGCWWWCNAVIFGVLPLLSVRCSCSEAAATESLCVQGALVPKVLTSTVSEALAFLWAPVYADCTLSFKMVAHTFLLRSGPRTPHSMAEGPLPRRAVPSPAPSHGARLPVAFVYNRQISTPCSILTEL